MDEEDFTIEVEWGFTVVFVTDAETIGVEGDRLVLGENFPDCFEVWGDDLLQAVVPREKVRAVSFRYDDAGSPQEESKTEKESFH